MNHLWAHCDSTFPPGEPPKGRKTAHREETTHRIVSFLCDKGGVFLCVLCNKLSDVVAVSGRMTVMHRLLFIEDDENIRLALRLALEDEGYEVREAPDGLSGIAEFGEMQPDLVLLDLRLPDISGFDVCRQIRAKSLVPIIMVTAQTDTHDLVAGLEAGADDYITKPVVPKELAARIRAALRRVQLHEGSGVGVPAPSVTRVADVEIRRDLGVVTKAGIEVQLTKTEYRLLCEFADHPGQVLSRDQLLEHVWGYEYLGDSRLVDAHVRRLRVKVEDHPDEPRIIVTARGIGYRLMP